MILVGSFKGYDTNINSLSSLWLKISRFKSILSDNEQLSGWILEDLVQGLSFSILETEGGKALSEVEAGVSV